MCIGASVVKEVQYVTPVVQQRFRYGLEVFIFRLLNFLYPFHEFIFCSSPVFTFIDDPELLV